VEINPEINLLIAVQLNLEHMSNRKLSPKFHIISKIAFSQTQPSLEDSSPLLLTPWSKSASELYRPSDRRLSAKRLPTFADRGSHVVSVTNPYGRVLDFRDRLFYQVAPQLYSGD
jgi:hypothetical protein